MQMREESGALRALTRTPGGNEEAEGLSVESSTEFFWQKCPSLLFYYKLCEMMHSFYF